MRRMRLWLCLPAVLAGLADLCLTLLGQPATYWDGNLWAAREDSPHGLRLFHQHHLAFPLAFAGWIAIYCTAILRLPRRLARIAALAVTIGHVTAGYTWIRHYAGYWGTILTAIVFAAVIVLALEREEREWAQ